MTEPISSSRRRIGLAALATLSGVPGWAWAQGAYPQRPIKLIAPFPPAGTSDVLSRIIARKLGEALGQTITVENKPGASANIGHDFVAKSNPDGYTLVITNSSVFVSNPYLFKRMPFDPFTDFESMGLVASAGQVLIVHPSVPARTVAELTALAKSRPGKLNFGSGGKGIQSHVSGEMYKAAVGVDIVHVPYKGTIQAVTDLVAGQVEMVFSDMVPAMPQIKAGTVRALAVTSATRSSALPDVPTMIEAGVPGFNAGVWWALLGPKGTPPAVIQRINTEWGKISKDPEVVEAYARLGVNTEHSTPARVLEMARAEYPVMGKLLRDAGVQAE